MPRLLAGHFQQAQMGPAENMRLGAVTADDALQLRDDLLPVLLPLHVNEINDNNAARIPQTDKPPDLFRRQQIGPCYSILEVRPAGVLSRIHINNSERLCLIPNERSPAFKDDFAAEALMELLPTPYAEKMDSCPR